MDIGSLIAAALLSLGLIGTDAVLNAGNVVFQVGVTKKLADKGYTPAVVCCVRGSSSLVVVAGSVWAPASVCWREQALSRIWMG